MKVKLPPNYKVYNQNILDFNIQTLSDLALILWNGVCDFNDQEQFSLFEKTHTLLQAEGVMCVDYIDSSKNALPKNGVEKGDQIYSVISGGFAYIPPFEEVKKRIEMCGFVYIEKRSYQTKTNPKLLLIFKKKMNTK